MITKRWVCFWNKTSKQTTVHFLSCNHIQKHVGAGKDKDEKGKWGYEQFDTSDAAIARWKEYGSQGYKMKECSNCITYMSL